MARKKRNFGRYRRGRVQTDDVLGALAAATVDVQSIVFGGGVTDSTRVSSVVATYSLENTVTQGATDGPITFGLAHSDYSVTEIKEYLENFGSWDEGNMIAKEITKRLIRQVGVFEIEAGGTGRVSSFQDGKPVKTKLNWLLNEDDTIHLFWYNSGNSAMTTGMSIHCSGHANLWFQ